MTDPNRRTYALEIPTVSPYLQRPLRSYQEVLAERRAQEREASVVTPFMPMVSTRCGGARTATASLDAA